MTDLNSVISFVEWFETNRPPDGECRLTMSRYYAHVWSATDVDEYTFVLGMAVGFRGGMREFVCVFDLNQPYVADRLVGLQISGSPKFVFIDILEFKKKIRQEDADPIYISGKMIIPTIAEIRNQPEKLKGKLKQLALDGTRMRELVSLFLTCKTKRRLKPQ